MGQDRTSRYTAALRDALKGLVRGTVVTGNRDDLRPNLQMATSGRHCIFFEADQSRILVVRVLHDRMDYRRHLETNEPPDE
jgi:toxin ParE1/3/4